MNRVRTEIYYPEHMDLQQSAMLLLLDSTHRIGKRVWWILVEWKGWTKTVRITCRIEDELLHKAL